jgi:hypothetical protein
MGAGAKSKLHDNPIARAALIANCQTDRFAAAGNRPEWSPLR